MSADEKRKGVELEGGRADQCGRGFWTALTLFRHGQTRELARQTPDGKIEWLGTMDELAAMVRRHYGEGVP